MVYLDGFLWLLVLTPNGLKRRHMFLELQHTTQKDKHNWQTKVRKYKDLFDRGDNLVQFFSTRTSQVLVVTMDTQYVASHKQWTEEVLRREGDRGRAYGDRFHIGSYVNTVSETEFFLTPRFAIPFQDRPCSLFGT